MSIGFVPPWTSSPWILACGTVRCGRRTRRGAKLFSEARRGGGGLGKEISGHKDFWFVRVVLPENCRTCTRMVGLWTRVGLG